jgi:hypothetical protein
MAKLDSVFVRMYHELRFVKVQETLRMSRILAMGLLLRGGMKLRGAAHSPRQMPAVILSATSSRSKASNSIGLQDFADATILPSSSITSDP